MKLKFPRTGLDAALFMVLVVGYCAWLLSTVHDLGYSRDEGFYFAAADAYAKWFEVLFENPAKAIEKATVDRYWRVNSEHPALIKSLFAFSRSVLHEKLGWFEERGTSYRFVGMAFSSLAVGMVFVWTKQALSRAGSILSRSAGLVAALSFAFIPRVFYHSHLDCFDMPVLAMWLFTSYAYWRSVRARSVGWALGTALLYGLLLNTKHNSWLLPFALVAHLLLTQGFYLIRELGSGRLRIPLALPLMATLSPLLFYATWPWIWFDTVDRLEAYVKFHTAHVYYNMEFLGQTYFEPPFPRSYAWLMTLSTVPAITLLLAVIGIAAFAMWAFQGLFLPWFQARKEHGLRGSLQPLPHFSKADHDWYSTAVLWLLCVVISYAPWVRDSSPIFGGTKHWMTAYPFLCMFGGAAFVLLCEKLRQLPALTHQRPWPELTAAACVLAAPLAITINSHPWGLSTYTPLAGGAAGGANLGLNRSFWGYTTGSVQEVINERAPKRAKIFIHDTAMQSFRMMQKDGRIRKDLRPQIGVAYSKIGVYHHEQHMARVEHQIWVDYGTVSPVHVAGLNGVPVVWLYERPKKK